MYLGGEPAGEHAAQSPALLQESRQEDEQRGSATKASIRSSRATPTRMVTPCERQYREALGQDAPEGGGPIRKAVTATATATTIRAPARMFEKTGMPIR